MQLNLNMEEWNEQQVLNFVRSQGLGDHIDIGLINGRQLSELDEQSCLRLARGHRDYGDKLFRSLHGSSDYYRLEDNMKDDIEAPVKIDPGHHKFPSLFDRPGMLAGGVIVLALSGVTLCCTILKEPLGIDVGPFLTNVSIPALMVPFTYFHIWMALWMTFYPLRFIGCWQIPGTNMGFPIGWQGIVPFKVVEMAQLAVKMMTTKLLTVDEIFSRLDPDVVASKLEKDISTRMVMIINEIAIDEAPGLWKVLPEAVKEQVYREASRESPTVIRDMLQELQANLEECFDLEELVVSTMVEDLELSNNMFIQCADRELAFIRDAGAWMGGFFGLIQMFVKIQFSQVNKWILLPGIGTIAGGITNWIALFAIFNPIEPIPLCGGRFVWQGLFLKRQHYVSALYGHIVGRRVLPASRLNRALMQGPKSGKVREIARKHIRVAFEKAVSPLRSGVLSFALPASLSDALDRIGNRLAENMAMQMYDVMKQVEPYMDEQFNLEASVRDRMRALPPGDFESLLHPVFQQDEWKLVLCGAALGAGFGLFQASIDL